MAAYTAGGWGWQGGNENSDFAPIFMCHAETERAAKHGFHLMRHTWFESQIRAPPVLPSIAPAKRLLLRVPGLTPTDS